MPELARLLVAPFPVLALLLLGGCGGAEPEPPATGTVAADLRQSSRDAALGRMQVWLVNDTGSDIEPTRIIYRDARFQAPVEGDRLRNIPAGSLRGFSLVFPEPSCSGQRTAEPLIVEYAGQRLALDVADENDIVARHVDRRCLELAVAQVATLRFSDKVPVEGDHLGSAATLVLLVEPSGSPGGELRIEEVHGTPVFSSIGQPVWTPGVTVRSDGQAQRIELPVQPARCDPHAFAESGGATAFLIRLELNGRSGDLVLRMSANGARAAIDYAVASCGLD